MADRGRALDGVVWFRGRAGSGTNAGCTRGGESSGARGQAVEGNDFCAASTVPYRANNDLLYYHLDVRVDPKEQSISGTNTIRFRMLKDDAKIQLDLSPSLNVDKIVFGDKATQVREGIQRGLRHVSGDAQGGSGLFD